MQALDEVADVYNFFTNELVDYSFYFVDKMDTNIARIDTLESRIKFLFEEDTYQKIFEELERLKKYFRAGEFDTDDLKEEAKIYDVTLDDSQFRTMQLVAGNNLKFAIALLKIIMPKKIGGILKKYELKL